MIDPFSCDQAARSDALLGPEPQEYIGICGLEFQAAKRNSSAEKSAAVG
jgi:hypothetical protein